MTVKTITAKVATAAEPSYTELLRRVRSLFARDVETRFEMAVIFGKMLKYKTSAEVAEDTDMSPGGVERIARVAEFWGNVRIKPDGAGKRPAPWSVYDRVALDQVMTGAQKETIKRAAPVKGLSVVRQLITDARRPELRRVEEIVRGKRAALTTAPRTSAPPRRSRNVNVPPPPPRDSDDGGTLVHHALTAIDAAQAHLDRLESLSPADATRLQRKIDSLVQQYVRLTEV
jgi:hypothetical protein